MAETVETLAEVLDECRWCPPGCPRCEPADCECYRHQDWPDKTTDPDWPYLAARIVQARAGEGALRERIEAVADWLDTERDSIRAAYIGHNAGRAPDRPVKRPDLSAWANAYEVAGRNLRAALDPEATT